jgi:hypothetical protein
MEIRLKDIPVHAHMRRAHARKDLGRNRERTGARKRARVRRRRAEARIVR